MPAPKYSIKVGVSQCLLGDAVRYDGRSKASSIIIEELSKLFDLLPVCPEVGAGLPIPRPPVQLTGSIEQPRLIGRDDPTVDVTDIMKEYCMKKPYELDHLSGFIFKSHSPSCGLNSTPVFINGRRVTENNRGIFARYMCTAYPTMPVIEGQELEDSHRREQFIQSVLRFRKN